MAYMNIKDMTFETSNFSSTWLESGIGFSYVKVAHEIAREYAHSGKVTFSNAYFTRKPTATTKGAGIELTERAIQWALLKLESTGIIERKYANDTRTKRTEITVNEEALLRVLSMRKKDFESLDRNNPLKHIRTQMPATVKPSKAKSLLRRLEREKNQEKREALIAQISAIHEQYKEYDDYVIAVIKRNEKYLLEHDLESNKEENSKKRIQALRELFPKTLGIQLPSLQVNF